MLKVIVINAGYQFQKKAIHFGKGIPDGPDIEIRSGGDKGTVRR